MQKKDSILPARLNAVLVQLNKMSKLIGSPLYEMV